MAHHSSAEEQAFWEQTYQLSGPDREKLLYARYIDTYLYCSENLLQRLAGLRGQTILSLGGGFDRPAVFLARQGNRVTTVDLSETAVAQTAELARQEGVHDLITFRVGNAEQMDFDLLFDVVVCKSCLHHMNLHQVLPRIVGWMNPGGRFYAEEPVSLSRILDYFHKHVPIYTTPYIQGEVQFNPTDLDFFRSHFPNLRIDYFDFLTREVIAYLLYSVGLERLLRPLGRFDCLLLNRWLPVLRPLSSYVILEATR